jgi:hypothetical protein
LIGRAGWRGIVTVLIAHGEPDAGRWFGGVREAFRYSIEVDCFKNLTNISVNGGKHLTYSVKKPVTRIDL